MLVPLVIAFYAGAFAADIAFAWADRPFFRPYGDLLMGAGIAMSVPAATIGFLDFLLEPKIRDLSAAWVASGREYPDVPRVDHGLGSALPGRSRDRSQEFISLSAATFLLLLFSGWMGGQDGLSLSRRRQRVRV